MESLIKAHPKATLKPQVVAETDHFRWSIDKDAVLARVRAGLMKLGLLGLETAFVTGKTAWEYRELLLGTLVAGVLAGVAMSSQESPKNPLQDAPTSPAQPERTVENHTYTVEAGDTLWDLVGNFLGTKNNEQLDLIKDRLFTQYGDRINHLTIGEKITIQSVNGKIEVIFQERK